MSSVSSVSAASTEPITIRYRPMPIRRSLWVLGAVFLFVPLLAMVAAAITKLAKGSAPPELTTLGIYGFLIAVGMVAWSRGKLVIDRTTRILRVFPGDVSFSLDGLRDVELETLDSRVRLALVYSNGERRPVTPHHYYNRAHHESVAEQLRIVLAASPELADAAVPALASTNDAMLAFQQQLAALTPRPWLAQLLVAVNVAVFVLMAVRGVSPMAPTSQALIEWGANHGPRTLGGEGYRVITAMFLHVGLIHLLFNMAVLWDSGRMLERILGTLDFAIVYFIAGAFGSMASVVWRPDLVSAGASGALFGMYGALFGFLLRNKQSLPEPVVARLKKAALVFIGYNLVFGMMIANVDMAAHLGGLAAGFACGAFIERPLTREGRKRTVGRMAVAAVLAAVVVFAALRTLPKPFDLQRALTDFGAVEEDVIAKANSVAKRQESGELSNTQMADLFEKEVLTPWKQGSAKFAAGVKSAKLTDAQRAQVTKIVSYVELRAAHWELYIEAVRTDDQATLDKALAKQKEADEAARAISKK